MPPCLSNRWRLPLWTGAAFLLSVPAIAMALGAGVDWSPGDFFIMGLLMGLACGGYEVAARLSGHWTWRAGAAIAIATSFLGAWVNLAVGMVGSQDNPANLLFVGIVLLAIAGAGLAGFRPRGTARVMQFAAGAQGAMAAYAFFVDDPGASLAIALFVAPWLLAACLFLQAEADP